MGDDGKVKRKKRRTLSVVLSLVFLVVMTLVVLSLLPGDRLGLSRLSGMFSPQATEFTVSELAFDVGRNRQFSSAEGAVAAAGSLGIQVLGSDGRETLRDSFRMTQPAIAEAGGNFLAYDIGGTALRVFSALQVYSSIETESEIVSASINKNGWFCIVTQQSGGYRCTVTVYNGIGVAVYKVYLRSGFVLSAHLSPDNKNLAILNLTSTGSRITFYKGIDTDVVEPDYLYDLPDGLIIDIRFISSEDILAVSMNDLQLIDITGSGTVINSFSDKRLGGYTISDKFIALHLYNYGIGYSGSLISLSYNGTVLGEMELNYEIFSMASFSNTLTILRSDGIAFFNVNLEEYPVSGDNVSAAATSSVLALGEGLALATSDHSAVLVHRLQDN